MRLVKKTFNCKSQNNAYYLVIKRNTHHKIISLGRESADTSLSTPSPFPSCARIIGSFRNGNPTLDCACRVQISAVGIELETLRTLRIHYGRRQKLGRPNSADAAEGLANQRPSLARVSVHALHVHKQYTAELRRSIAKALVRHNGPKKAVPSRLVASCVALRKLPNVSRSTVNCRNIQLSNKFL